MKIQIDSYDANGVRRAALPATGSVPIHNHTNVGSGGQLHAGSVFNAGAVPIDYGGTGETTANAAFAALAPLTTKGDLIARDVNAPVRVPIGSNGALLVADSAQAAGLRWTPAFQWAEIRDERSSGTHGGSSVANSWQTRALNTENDPHDLVWLINDTFGLAAGVYWVSAQSMFRAGTAGTRGRLRLQNNTTGTTLAVSPNAFASADGSFTPRLDTLLIANGTDTFVVQYYVSLGVATYGLGLAVSSGDPEIYTVVTLLRLRE